MRRWIAFVALAFALPGPAQASGPLQDLRLGTMQAVFDACAGDDYFSVQLCVAATRGVRHEMAAHDAQFQALCSNDDRAHMLPPPVYLRRVQAMARAIHARPIDPMPDGGDRRVARFSLGMFAVAVQDFPEDCAVAFVPDALRPAFLLARHGKVSLD